MKEKRNCGANMAAMPMPYASFPTAQMPFMPYGYTADYMSEAVTMPTNNNDQAITNIQNRLNNLEQRINKLENNNNNTKYNNSNYYMV